MNTAVTQDPVVMRRKGRRTLLFLFLVSLAPVVAGYVAFYFWQPAAGMNYGELLQPPVAVWSAAEAPAALRGKWVLLVSAPAACDEACRNQLWLTRQVRTIQGKEMDRVARAWLQSGDAANDAALMAEHPGLVLLRDERIANLLGDSGAARIGLVDPKGMLMMRYPAQPDAKRMVKDLERLLKYVQAG